MTERVLLIEFNELSPALLERFIRAGQLPNFKRLRDTSDVFATDSGEADATLVPWIVWPSIHTGAAFGDHNVFHLGEAHRLELPTVSAVLHGAGISCGTFGSMNVPAAGNEGFYLPDPWDRASSAVPESLQRYYDVTASQVKESSHHGKLGGRDVIALATYYLMHGFRLQTAVECARQLVGERREPGLRWRRAALFDQIQYDVFHHLVTTRRVAFASFFSNSTAHFQHLYWRNMEPAAFPDPPEAGTHASLTGAILHGYQSMDSLIGRFLTDFPAATLVFATGLSQVPYTGPILRNYRPVDFKQLLEFAGLGGATAAPVMTHQFHVTPTRGSSASVVAQALEGLTVDGQSVLEVRTEPEGVFSGCRYFDPDVLEKTVRALDGRTERFDRLFYLIDGYRSGHHHTDGALWIRTSGAGLVHEQSVSVLDIAPTILSFFGVPTPGSMRGTRLPLGVADARPRGASAPRLEEPATIATDARAAIR